MQKNGNVITFEYVSHYDGHGFRYNQQFAIVSFEGELETWVIQDRCLNTADAVRELREYYEQEVSIVILYPTAIFGG